MALTLTIFLVLLIIAALVLYAYFRSKLESGTITTFDNYISSSALSWEKIRFANILTYFVNKGLLVQKIKQGLTKNNNLNQRADLVASRCSSFLLFAAVASEEVIIPGYDKVIGLLNIVLTFVFLIIILSMFKNFIMGGITEAVYKFLHNTSAETIDNIIRKLTIKTDLDVLVKNSLESMREAKKEETKEKV